MFLIIAICVLAAVGNRNSSGLPMTATSAEAIEQANWFARHALDRLPDDPAGHPGIQGHLTAARVQLEAALTLAASSQKQQWAAPGPSHDAGALRTVAIGRDVRRATRSAA